ncbi:ArsR/SmtB family transcription factor [Virgibacillus sp. FSP13]
MMEQMMTLTTHNQLKALGDPLRAEMMMHLIEKPYTGQQLAEAMNIPRGKMHYHLKELEKNNLIEMIKTEEKNGIIQKFYQSVSGSFTISEKLLPHQDEINQTTRQVIYSILDRAKRRLEIAPSYAFENKNHSENPEDWGYITTNGEFKATEKQFIEWKKKYYALMRELQQLGEETSEDTNTYYFLHLGFQIEEEEFQIPIDKGKSDNEDIKK